MRRLLIILFISLNLFGFKSEEVNLNKDNFILLRGEINDVMIGSVIRGLESRPADTVYLVVDSPGGEIMAGIELINYLQQTHKNIKCVVKTAISMAFAITQFCSERLIIENAVMMQHVAAYSLEGREPNNLSMALFIRKISNYLDSKQAARMGIDLKDFQSKTRDDWWFFTAQDAIDSKAADSLAIVKCAEELFALRLKTTSATMFGAVEISWSGCPVIGVPLFIKENISNQMPRHIIDGATQEALDKMIPARFVKRKG